MIITVSLSALTSVSIMPDALSARPATPIQSATAIAITTQIDATRLESLRFFSSFIAIKRSNICGIPKYPKPHDTVVIICKRLYGVLVFVAGSYEFVSER